MVLALPKSDSNSLLQQLESKRRRTILDWAELLRKFANTTDSFDVMRGHPSITSVIQCVEDVENSIANLGPPDRADPRVNPGQLYCEDDVPGMLNSCNSPEIIERLDRLRVSFDSMRDEITRQTGTANASLLADWPLSGSLSNT